MRPPENPNDEERDFRFGMLRDELGYLGIPKSEAFGLHVWLSGLATDQLVEQAVQAAVGTQSQSRQIEACKKLEKSASVISNQFDFLNQVSSLEYILSQAYGAIVQSENRHDQTTQSDEFKEWVHFRERVASDAMRLTQIAKKSVAELEFRGSKKGRPTKDWKNDLFTELVERLLRIGCESQEERIALAREVWNLYFPDEEMDTTFAAHKTFQRVRKRRQSQGH